MVKGIFIGGPEGCKIKFDAGLQDSGKHTTFSYTKLY